MKLYTDTKYYVLQQVVRVGYGFVAAAVLPLSLTICTFPQWRKKYQNQLFVHFAMTRHLSNLLFMIVIGNFDKSDYDNFHSYAPIDFLISFITPTVQLAASLWTLISTKHLYDTFVVVIYVKEEHKMLKQVLLVWTMFVPLVLCITVTSMTVAVVRPSEWPWPKFNLWYSIIMRWPLIFVNFVMYCKVVYCVLKTYNNTNRRNNKALRTVSVFAVLFVVMALQGLVDEMRSILLILTKRDGFDFIKYHDNKRHSIIGNSVLIAVSYLASFLSTAYWLWGNADDRRMWSLFIRNKLYRL